MMKIDWIAKLTSRKFWMAICGFITGLLLTFNADKGTVDKIGGLIMSAASVTAYIFGEGMADAAAAQQNVTYIAKEDEPPDVDDLK